MLFSSYSFSIIFLPVLVMVYYVIPEKWRNYILLLASLFFYAWGGPKYLFVMLLSIGINYLSGLLLDRYRDSTTTRKIITALAVIGNLSLLGYYKYTDFIIENVNSITGATIPLRHILLPIGISFYTFQGLSYVLDIGRNKGKVLKNPLKLALYISFFPQLIAGPIVRYETIATQIDHRIYDKAKVNEGVFRFVLGLSKKVLLANMIGELATWCFSINTKDLTWVSAWTGAIAYTLQIYYDFSGYSDMAIGLGAIFGFSFPENFNYPYIADSITDFWRRWHISLSTWFRDYVYIPLGGNRKGIARQYFNIAVVWLLTGLWHGASWNFVAWGGYYALLLMAEKFVVSKAKFKSRIITPVKHIYTLVAITVGWVIFESATLTDAVGYVGKMFNFSFRSSAWGSQINHIWHEYGLILVIGCIFSAPVIRAVGRFIQDRLSSRSKEILKSIVMIVLFLVCFMRLVVSSYNPFIYFRF